MPAGRVEQPGLAVGRRSFLEVLDQNAAVVLPSLVGAYFGGDTALVNFGVLYSAKAVGAVLGVGLAAFVVLPDGYPVCFAVAAMLSVADAAVLGSLRRPGLPRLSLPIPAR